VNEASKLCAFGNRTAADRTLMVSKVFQNKLNEVVDRAGVARRDSAASFRQRHNLKPYG